VGYAASLIGLSFGALLMATGLALWDGFRSMPGLAHAIRVLRWGVGGLLLVAILPLWGAGRSALVLSLTLMAAIAAPPARRDLLPRRGAVALLPVLVLAGTCTFLVTGLVQTGGDVVSSASLVATVYGGLAARVLSEALGALASPAEVPGRLFDTVYLLLTLLLGANALTNLWQRGLAWEGTPDESGLLGVWLAWSAAWLSPRRRPRLRAGLVAIAALLLIVLALKAD
jgi:hypothetical protein